MTLDDAIKHAEEVAEGYEKIKCIKAVTLEECKCAAEHRQLAEWLKDYKRLKEQDPCNDAISREWLKIAINNFYYGLKHTPIEEDIQAYIDAAPSVTPQPKTGHWIYKRYGGYEEQGNYHCSECGNVDNRTLLYCPYCGTKMAESDDKG